MTLHRRAALAALALAAALTAPLALAQGKKDSVTLAMVLEPPGLDPTIAPAAAIGEIVHYNVLEGLTKVNVDGSVTPLLAEGWTMDPDGRSYTFKLKKGIKYHDGAVSAAASASAASAARRCKVIVSSCQLPGGDGARTRGGGHDVATLADVGIRSGAWAVPAQPPRQVG